MLLKRDGWRLRFSNCRRWLWVPAQGRDDSDGFMYATAVPWSSLASIDRHLVVPALSRDPYAAADVVKARWLAASLQQLPPVAMGPGSRPGRQRGWLRAQPLTRLRRSKPRRPGLEPGPIRRGRCC